MKCAADGEPSRQRARRADFTLIASPALLDELRDVLSRPRFRRWVRLDVAAGDRHLLDVTDPVPPVLTPRRFLDLPGA